MWLDNASSFPFMASTKDLILLILNDKFVFSWEKKKFGLRFVYEKFVFDAIRFVWELMRCILFELVDSFTQAMHERIHKQLRTEFVYDRCTCALFTYMKSQTKKRSPRMTARSKIWKISHVTSHTFARKHLSIDSSI